MCYSNDLAFLGVETRAARFVFNNYTDRTPGCVTKMVESLKWEKLEERRKTNRLCMLYKIKNGLISLVWCSL
jgi:hypothetical protein